MTKHDIPLELLLPKNRIKTKIENGALHVPSEVENLGKHRHHINIPGKYKLPFRIDMSIRVTYHEFNQIASQLRLCINKGNIYFNGGHTSVTDIITGDDVSPSFICFNDISSEEYVDITVMFGTDIMWVSVNKQFCFASDKMPYLSIMHENANLDTLSNGFDIALCGGTATRFSLKPLAVTEYHDEPDIPEELVNLPELTGFEAFVKGLPSAIQNEMYGLDAFLMEEPKGTLKFKKSINKIGHLTYESTCGFRFEIKEYGAGLTFLTCWAKSPKKPDFTNEIIIELAKSSPDTAKKLFNKILGCELHSRECPRTVFYELMGETKSSCSGRMNIKMDASGFDDLKKFIITASTVIKTK